MDNTIKIRLLKFVLFISIFFYSCKGDVSNKNEIKTISVSEQNKETELERKLKNEPKLFLKYWSGMTLNEFIKVSEILLKEGVLKGSVYQLNYVTNNCNIPIERIEKDGLIIGIELTEDVDCIYPLYQRKYNLPSMVERNMDLFYLKANNPKYKPVTSYFNGVNTVQLPNCFIDKTSLLPTNSPQKLDINSLPYQSIKRILPQNKIIVENGSNIIIIEQEIKTSERIIYRYSLEDSKEMQQYESSEEGQKRLGLGATMTGDKNSLGNFIYTNSKTRTWVVSSYVNMSITYTSKKEYNKKLQEQKMELNNKAEQELNRERNKKELEKRVFDDI
tara:strand:- start:13797 stop:14792 length:996 start_codon:yes stop_codon:yes gene_type:complete